MTQTSSHLKNLERGCVILKQDCFVMCVKECDVNIKRLPEPVLTFGVSIDSLWNFFEIPNVQTTNNHAERQLRPLVIYLRNSVTTVLIEINLHLTTTVRPRFNIYDLYRYKRHDHAFYI